MPTSIRPGGMMQPECLLRGLDTVQCAYYLATGAARGIDFKELRVQREELRHAKTREPRRVRIGGQEFLLQPYGSNSGYPIVLDNDRMKIECGEFNNPSFFVTYRSQALWSVGAWQLNQQFNEWAVDLGLVAVQSESLSRVDFCFDYFLSELDFDEDHFVTRATKDSRHRSRGEVQTFTFGKGDVMLRVYDKVAEIREQSNKVWFFELWGRDTDVWRIEWQVRKLVLKRFGIRTFADLQAQMRDVLGYLALEHDSLRRPQGDVNRSRWPLHPLWLDLKGQIENMDGLGVHRIEPQDAVVRERIERLGVAVYGYLKQLAALRAVQGRRDGLTVEETLEEASRLVQQVYNPFSWRADVEKRITALRLGQW